MLITYTAHKFSVGSYYGEAICVYKKELKAGTTYETKNGGWYKGIPVIDKVDAILKIIGGCPVNHFYEVKAAITNAEKSARDNLYFVEKIEVVKELSFIDLVDEDKTGQLAYHILATSPVQDSDINLMDSFVANRWKDVREFCAKHLINNNIQLATDVIINDLLSKTEEDVFHDLVNIICHNAKASTFLDMTRHAFRIDTKPRRNIPRINTIANGLQVHLSSETLTFDEARPEIAFLYYHSETSEHRRRQLRDAIINNIPYETGGYLYRHLKDSKAVLHRWTNPRQDLQIYHNTKTLIDNNVLDIVSFFAQAPEESLKEIIKSLAPHRDRVLYISPVDIAFRDADGSLLSYYQSQFFLGNNEIWTIKERYKNNMPDEVKEAKKIVDEWERTVKNDKRETKEKRVILDEEIRLKRLLVRAMCDRITSPSLVCDWVKRYGKYKKSKHANSQYTKMFGKRCAYELDYDIEDSFIKCIEKHDTTGRYAYKYLKLCEEAGVYINTNYTKLLNEIISSRCHKATKDWSSERLADQVSKLND